MVESNTAYHKSFKPVKEHSAFQERAKLREKLDQAYDRLKFKRQDEHGIVGDAMQAEARCAQLQEEEVGISSAVQQLVQRRDEAADAIQVSSCRHDRYTCSVNFNAKILNLGTSRMVHQWYTNE
jgi:uncharacterized protein YhaN